MSILNGLSGLASGIGGLLNNAAADATPPVAEPAQRPDAAPAPTAAKPDPYDYTDRYNTALSPDEEARYQAWGKEQAAARADGKNPAADTYDYDMRGFWKSGQSLSDNGHAGDLFKKPNHPTFSNQSQYHGVDGNEGGVWGGGQSGQPWTFTPGATNLQTHDTGDLQRYFEEVEPGNKLILPGAAATQPAASAAASAAGVPAALIPVYQAASKRTGIPVAVLIAQGRQESDFNPNEIGSAGEIGIHQIKPSTALEPGYGVTPIDPKTLKDPVVNINFAASYLRAKAGMGVDFSDPRVVDHALALYNAGGDPHYVSNVRRYMGGA